MTPGLGQGANMALEDCAELMFFLSGPGMPLEEALARWEASRKDRVREVHSWSRAQTQKNSEDTKHSNDPSDELKNFLEGIYKYVPPTRA